MATSKATIKKAIEENIKDPQLREVVSHFFDLNGGPEAIAKFLTEEMKAAPAGSPVRQRILDMILGCMKRNEKDVMAEDMSMMDDKDLETAIEEALKQIPHDK